MYDKAINRYIKAVTKDIGWKQRKEVKRELRAHILDGADALAAERHVPVDDAIIKEVIHRMGPPAEIAEIYPAGKKRFYFDVIFAGIAIFVDFFKMIIGIGTFIAYQLGRVEYRKDHSSHAGAGKIDLELDNAKGRIDIVESATNIIEVIYSVSASKGHLGDIVTNTTYIREGDTLRVISKAKIASDYGIHIGYFNRYADALVKVPRDSQYRLYLTTSHGDVRVAALNGSSMIINTNYGRIDVDGGNYDRILAATSWGKITAKYSSTSAIFSNCNGDIHIESGRTGGSLLATTSRGNITAKYCSTCATFSNSNGDIHIEPGRTGGSIQAATSRGSVRVRLKEGTPFSMDASVSSGRILYDPFPMVGEKYGESHLIGYKENEQSTLEMVLSASNGNVEISS